MNMHEMVDNSEPREKEPWLAKYATRDREPTTYIRDGAKLAVWLDNRQGSFTWIVTSQEAFDAAIEVVRGQQKKFFWVPDDRLDAYYALPE